MNIKKYYSTLLKSQFNYCPLIWMFCSRTRNNQINSIQERALRITYNNYRNSYSELLQMYKVKSVHQNNIHFLMIEVYRFLNGLSPQIMNDIFRLRKNTYNLRNFRLLECRNLKTSIYGTETVTYKSSLLWNIQSLPKIMAKSAKNGIVLDTTSNVQPI